MDEQAEPLFRRHVALGVLTKIVRNLGLEIDGQVAPVSGKVNVQIRADGSWGPWFSWVGWATRMQTHMKARLSGESVP